MRALRSDVPVSRAASLNDFVRWLDDAGVPHARELEWARLPRGPLPASAVLPAFSILHFAADVARREGVDDLGVRAALHPEAEAPRSPLTWRLAASSNGFALLEAMRDLLGVYSSHVPAWLRETPRNVWFCMRGSTTPDEPGARFAEQYRVATVVVALRGLLGASWRPREVHLECRGPVPLSFAEVLGASVIRTGMDYEALAIPRALLAKPPVLPRPNGQTKPAPDDPPAVLADLGDWTERLGAVLASGARHGFGSLPHSAEVLGLGPRTLQRRLRSVGLTFSNLVERARVSEAQRLLRDPQIPIRVVAYRVGYGNPSSFARAYGRHTGSTPSASRAPDSAS